MNRKITGACAGFLRPSFDHSLEQIGAAVFLSWVIVGGIAAFTVSSAADNAEGVTILVNRNNKGDRLPQSSVLSRHLDDHSGRATTPPSPERPPLGCDPAFSPIVAPGLAHIFNRCLT